MSTRREAPDVRFRFPAGRREFAPGEELRVEVSVSNLEKLSCRAAEASVLWRTVGQGDEDLQVHSFQRFTRDGADTLSLPTPVVIETTLPCSPMSYNGVNVKVCWCVRLRLFLADRRESQAEAAFRLGDTWSPQHPTGAPA